MSAPATEAAMRADKWHCKACRKTSYESESRGWQAIATIHGLPNRTEVVPIRVYECPFKNGWHLTHQRERYSA